MFENFSAQPTQIPNPDFTRLTVGETAEIRELMRAVRTQLDKLAAAPTLTVEQWPEEKVTGKAETDPNGKSLNEPGAKGDAGKLRPALVLGDFARALTAVAQVGTYGAVKYSPSGWLTVPNGIERYDEAMMRHWLKEKAGEDTDPDTGLLHQAHLAWNALAQLDLMLREKEAAK